MEMYVYVHTNAHTWKMGKQKTEMIILSPQFDPWLLGVTQFSSLTLTTIVTFPLVLVFK